MPEVCEPLPSAVPSPGRQSIRQDSGIDSARTRSNHCLHLEAAVFEQTVDHAPCKRAVRAASLQGELDLLWTCGGPGLFLCNMAPRLFSRHAACPLLFLCHAACFLLVIPGNPNIADLEI